MEFSKDYKIFFIPFKAKKFQQTNRLYAILNVFDYQRNILALPFHSNQIPTCKKCGCFLNRFDACNNFSVVCSICKEVYEINRLEYEIFKKISSNVYQCISSQFYFKNKKFYSPTEYFIISPSILANHDITSSIIAACNSGYSSQQYGLVIFHNQLSLLTFNDSVNITTLSDDIPSFDESKLFTFFSLFASAFKNLINSQNTFASDRSPKGLLKRFIHYLTTLKTVSFHIILSERDVEDLECIEFLDSELRQFTLQGIQFNSYIFANINNRDLFKGLIKASSVTGGISINLNRTSDVYKSLFSGVTSRCIYDTCVDFSFAEKIHSVGAYGIIEGKKLYLGKVQSSRCLIVELELLAKTSPLIQFTVDYSTYNGFHYYLVVTLNMYDFEYLSKHVIRQYIDSIIEFESNISNFHTSHFLKMVSFEVDN